MQSVCIHISFAVENLLKFNNNDRARRFQDEFLAMHTTFTLVEIIFELKKKTTRKEVNRNNNNILLLSPMIVYKPDTHKKNH